MKHDARRILGRKVRHDSDLRSGRDVGAGDGPECGPCTVLQVRTAERDGYHALQLGFLDKKRKSATQPERGHARKVDAEPKRYIREIRQEAPADVAKGRS